MDVNRLIEGFLGQAGIGQTKGGARNPQQGAGQGSGQDAGPSFGKSLGSLGNALPGGLAGGATAGGLMALLLGSKKGRKFGGKALTYGGLAVVGGLAYKAWTEYQAGRQTGTTGNAPVSVRELPAPPQNSPFDPTSQTDAQGVDLRLALVRAMIAAAKADGHIDAQENAKIQAEIEAMQLAADEKAFLFDQLNAESDPIAIARLAKGEEQSAEIYLASALAADVDTPEEQRYMQRLADALHLPDALRRQLDAHAEQAKTSA